MATKNRIRFTDTVIASDYATFHPGVILELADGTWPAEVQTWIDRGACERLPADALVAITTPVSRVGPADFALWFRERPAPPEMVRISYPDALKRFRWTAVQFETAVRFRFPPPVGHREKRTLTGGVSRYALYELAAVEAWERELRGLLWCTRGSITRWGGDLAGLSTSLAGVFRRPGRPTLDL